MTDVQIVSGRPAAYGEPGWTIDAGVWEVVGEFMPDGRVPWIDDDHGDLLPLGSRKGCSFVPSRRPAPVVEEFWQLDGRAAAVLLDRLTGAQLDAGVAGAPSVRSALLAAAGSPDSLLVNGWGLRPGSAYEGLMVTGICALDEGADGYAFGVGLGDYRASHEPIMVWGAVLQRFDLDGRTPPVSAEPIRRMPSRTPGWSLSWI